MVISAKGLVEHQDFPDLKALGRIESSRETGGIVQTETRHFALSWTPAPEVFMATVRAHWETRTRCIGSLTSCSAKMPRATARITPLPTSPSCAAAPSTLRRDTSKGSLSIKLKQAGWSDAFLLSLLNQLSGA